MEKKIEILLVEDNADDAELILHLLRKMNLQDKTLHVSDGEAALDYLFPEDIYLVMFPKLIILDIKMPKVDGFTVLEKIKSNPATKTIPVVILTSSNQEVDIKKAYETGANCYVVKPVDYKAFISAVESITTFWIMLNNNYVTSVS